MTYPDWTGRPAYVVAAGQSAADVVPNIPRDGSCHVMAVNRSFELVPWADALYAADLGFWMFYPAAKAFAGLKFSAAETVHGVCSAAARVTIARDAHGRRRLEMLFDTLGTIGSGENSGFQALNLTAQFNPNPIYLVGFDYCGKHWHPDHSSGLRNPSLYNLKRWAQLLDDQAAVLEARGFRVVNLSSKSVLRNFEHGNGSLPYPHFAPLPA